MTRNYTIILTAAALLLTGAPAASAYTPTELDHVERLEERIQALESKLASANERAAQKQARLDVLAPRAATLAAANRTLATNNRALRAQNQRQGWPLVQRLRVKVRRLTPRYMTVSQLWGTMDNIHLLMPRGCSGYYDYDTDYFIASGYSSRTFIRSTCYD
jgi:hypothetical protein